MTMQQLIFFFFSARPSKKEYLSFLKYQLKMESSFKFCGVFQTFFLGYFIFQPLDDCPFMKVLQVWTKPVLQTTSWLLFWHCKLWPVVFVDSFAIWHDKLRKKELCKISMQFNLKRGGQRVATMLIYLSGNVEGGETHFPMVSYAL